MDPKFAEAIGGAMAESLGEISLAMLVIVKALKEQPGFDRQAFDAVLLKAIDDPNNQKRSLTRSTLDAALDNPREI